jgi:hypothetical protein
MDSIRGAGRFWCFFYFWGLNHLIPGPLLPHLLWNHHKFLHNLHKKDPAESERMVLQKMGLGSFTRTDLRSSNGSECPVKASD